MKDRFPALYQRINWHILPLLGLGNAFAIIDRINISFAKLQMQQDIGISDATYGLGAGLFFIGYMLFEIPSNILLEKIGARKTFSRIMILWGLTSAAMMFVYDARGFYILRFLLGAFEAGFTVGAVFYFTLWYPESRMGRTLALFMSAPLLAGLIISPISTFI